MGSRHVAVLVVGIAFFSAMNAAVAQFGPAPIRPPYGDFLLVDANGMLLGKVDRTAVANSNATQLYAIVFGTPAVLTAGSDWMIGYPLYFANPGCTGQAYIEMSYLERAVYSPIGLHGIAEGTYDVYKADALTSNHPYVATRSKALFPTGCLSENSDLTNWIAAPRVGTIKVKYPLRIVEGL